MADEDYDAALGSITKYRSFDVDPELMHTAYVTTFASSKGLPFLAFREHVPWCRSDLIYRFIHSLGKDAFACSQDEMWYNLSSMVRLSECG
jgi:hypothetical protein